MVHTFGWSLCLQYHHTEIPKKVKQYTWRWDKSNLDYYYHCTDQQLRSVNVPVVCECDVSCDISSHLNALNLYYENIVAALHCAGHTAMHGVPCRPLKPFWNEELDRLKYDSIFWHNLWSDAGRPSSGVLNHVRLSCKAKYKLAVRNAYMSFEDKLSDEMYRHFVNKRIPEFWKSWNAKFKKNVNKHINVNGYTSDKKQKLKVYNDV